MVSERRRRLIVNADDFGRSASINEAVVRAHRDGILTTASLMVNEEGAAQAVAMAKQNPSLGVGLHVALCCGKAGLSHTLIPSLANARGDFSDNPVATGMNLFFSPRARRQLALELEEQFSRFHATGLTLDHVNGHLNIHLHPAVLGLLMENAARWGIQAVRLTRDPFWLNAKLARGDWGYKASHSLIYQILAARARPLLAAQRLKHTRFVFGLLQNSRVDTCFLESLLENLPAGDHEVYSHPSLDQFKKEFDALINPGMKLKLQENQIELLRYQDL